MMDRPSATELLDAVRDFLDRELQPFVTDSRLRFQLLVASNLLAIIEREIVHGEALALAEKCELTDLVTQLRLASSTQTSQDWRLDLRDLAAWFQSCNSADLMHADVRAYLRHHVTRKLTISNPRYLEAAR